MRHPTLPMAFFPFLFALSLTSCTPPPDPGTTIVEFTAGSGVLTWGRDTIGQREEWEQSFTVTESASCSQIKLLLGATAGAPTGNYTVRLETGDVDLSSGTLVSASAANTRTAGSLAALDWNAWNFNPAVQLSPGQVYWIVCQTDEPPSNDNAIRLQCDVTNGYLNGHVNGRANSGSWGPEYSMDLNFKMSR